MRHELIQQNNIRFVLIFLLFTFLAKGLTN